MQKKSKETEKKNKNLPRKTSFQDNDESEVSIMSENQMNAKIKFRQESFDPK